MSLLEATCGRQATDTYYLVTPPKFNDETSEMIIKFYVAGWRHYKDNLDFELQKGSVVSFEKEDKNLRDKKAIALLVNSQKIGYVPAFYSGYVWDYLDDCNAEGRIISINKSASPQLQVLMEAKCEGS